MAYVAPIKRPVPPGQLCQYGCGQDAIHWFKRPRKWCCSKTTNGCPVKKAEKKANDEARNKLKKKYPDINLDYVRAIYPHVYAVDVTDGTLRFNPDKNILEARCTYFECKNEWYEIPMNHIGFRQWALTPTKSGSTQGGDGYKFYCSEECRDLCMAHGKTGATIYKEIVMSHMIDWEEEEEWYGSEVSTANKNLWRETCLINDEFMCVRCGEPAVHVHHINPVKTHPMEVLDPVNGISTCLRCHYDHFHERGSICSLQNIAKKVCFSIVNGEAKRPKEKITIPSGVLTL